MLSIGAGHDISAGRQVHEEDVSALEEDESRGEAAV